MQKAFTLIEVLIYLTLFGLLMTGAVVSAYSALELSGRTQTRVMLTMEGNFILEKISWAMNGSASITITPMPPRATITRNGNPNVVVFDLASSTNSFCPDCMELKRATGTPVFLNNNNLKVQNANFFHSGGGSNPEFLTASFDLVGNTPEGKSLSQSFAITKYLHK